MLQPVKTSIFVNDKKINKPDINQAPHIKPNKQSSYDRIVQLVSNDVKEVKQENTDVKKHIKAGLPN